MIRSKKELEFYIKADYMMNRGYFKPSIKQKLRNIVIPDYIMQYLVSMRKTAYYSQKGGLCYFINKWKYKRLGLKLGISIGPEVFGYGLVLPHYGTIVVGDSNHCGNYCVLHTSTCISGNGKNIGDGLYLSTGAKITAKLVLGDNVTVGANAVVNKSFPKGDILLVGIPAIPKKIRLAWYIAENGSHKQRVIAIEKLKSTMGL